MFSRVLMESWNYCLSFPQSQQMGRTKKQNLNLMHRKVFCFFSFPLPQYCGAFVHLLELPHLFCHYSLNFFAAMFLGEITVRAWAFVLVWMGKSYFFLVPPIGVNFLPPRLHGGHSHSPTPPESFWGVLIKLAPVISFSNLKKTLRLRSH